MWGDANEESFNEGDVYKGVCVHVTFGLTKAWPRMTQAVDFIVPRVFIGK